MCSPAMHNFYTGIMLQTEGIARSKTLGTARDSEGQQARARVPRGKIRDQVFIGHGKTFGSSVTGMGSLLNRRVIQSGFHFKGLLQWLMTLDRRDRRTGMRRLLQ